MGYEPSVDDNFDDDNFDDDICLFCGDPAHECTCDAFNTDFEEELEDL